MGIILLISKTSITIIRGWITRFPANENSKANAAAGSLLAEPSTDPWDDFPGGLLTLY